MASAPCVTFAPVDPLDLALDEARSRLERANGRRADLRATTARLYGFLGGVLAVGLGVLIALGTGFAPWLAGAVLVGAGALLCIWQARPPRPGEPETVTTDLRTHAADRFDDDVLGDRLDAAGESEAALEHGRSWMRPAEWLAAATAVVLVVGAVVVVGQDHTRTARVPLGVPAAWEGGVAEYVLTPGARDGEELHAIANPRDGVPALVVGPSGTGDTGCLGPYDPASVLRRGDTLEGDRLAAVLGERRPEAPLQIALCVPRQRVVEGRRAIELTWSGRALD